MLLTKLNYYENESQPDEWQIEDLTLGSQNLIVGRNATGKTRLYRVISNFSKIITESMPYLNGRFDLTFTDSDVSYNYSIKITNGKVEYEYYRRDETLLISRDNTAMQIIHILNGEEQLREISPPENKLVIHVRRDNKEFPYIEMLHEWAGNIVSIRFIEQQSNSVRATAENASTVLDKDGTIYYAEILKNFDEEQINNVLADLESIGYSAEDIKRSRLQNVPVIAYTISVKEKDLKCETDQGSMSTGMYRALCVIIFLNYMLANRDQDSTLLIDDLGEGLDYERAALLTNLLFQKTQDTRIQTIITSNDRFLMNAVDITKWNILERNGHHVKCFNYTNSKEEFESFKYTGLNNFDFFSSQFYRGLEK